MRDSTLFLIYLGIMSYFLMGNVIENYAIYCLIVIYIIHVVLMKMNHTYEVALKKGVASFLEVKELSRMANEDIGHFHYNLDTRAPCIEVLNKINFRQEGDILIFENNAAQQKAAQGQLGIGQFMARVNNQIRYRMKAIQRIKIREERFATPDNKQLMARARLKQAVIKILTKLQAYHIYEKIKRNKHCVIPVNKFVKDYHHIPQTNGGGQLSHPSFGIGVPGMNSDQKINAGSYSLQGNLIHQLNMTSGDSDECFDDEVESSSEEISNEDSNEMCISQGSLNKPSSR